MEIHCNNWHKNMKSIISIWIQLRVTVNVERFAGLNICGFRSFSREYFCGTLTSSVYYLTIAKHWWENYLSTLKNCESLAQWIFPRLRHTCRYILWWKSYQNLATFSIYRNYSTVSQVIKLMMLFPLITLTIIMLTNNCQYSSTTI